MIEYLIGITKHLFGEIAVLLFFVFILAKTNRFSSIVLKQEQALSDRVFLTIFFGLVSIFGTYYGLPVDGAIANARAVGAVVGGLVGGPMVGAGAGAIAGAHRLLLGGPTVYASVLSTVVEGLLAGLIAPRINLHKERWPYALAVGAFLEILHMLSLLLSPPFEQAVAVLEAIGLPMIIINPIGIAAFIAIFDSLCRERERVEGSAAQLALEIANKTLGFLRQGLNPASAGKTVKIIYDSVGNLAAVAITSRDSILAFEGIGKDHHRSGGEEGIITESTRNVLESGVYMVVQEKDKIGCSNPDCLLRAKVVVPLTDRNTVVGSLVLYKTTENDITPFDEKLALGLGQLISTQIEVSMGERQAELRARAEIKALQAQINPHFLFNAINTIVYYCRKQPDTARELLLHLGQFYRNNLTGLEDLVDLDTEIRHVDSYVRIEMARFHGKLRVIYDIEPDCTCLLPPLTLQPIIENAIRHGLYPKKKGGTVKVAGRLETGQVRFIVEDDGVGMEAGQAARVLEYDPGRKTIGLSNVNGRLKNLYGEDFGLRIDSVPGQGTKVTVVIPVERIERDVAQGLSG